MPIEDQVSEVIAFKSAFDPLEVEAQKIFKQFFEKMGPEFQDLSDYGKPHLASGRVVEKFAKKDGLSILRREVTTDTIMRIIYANWIGKGGKRGLNFLEFALRMIWGNEYKIEKVFHSKPLAQSYPRFLSLIENKNTFLTSRRHITISKNINLKEVSELAPTLQQLVPANIVPIVLSEQSQSHSVIDLGVAIGGVAYTVVSL